MAPPNKIGFKIDQRSITTIAFEEWRIRNVSCPPAVFGGGALHVVFESADEIAEVREPDVESDLNFLLVFCQEDHCSLADAAVVDVFDGGTLHHPFEESAEMAAT